MFCPSRIEYFNRILYFDRITDTRMAGTKGKVLDLFKMMTGPKTGSTITVVTTMWDQLWKEEQSVAAEQRFEEMRTRYYKVCRMKIFLLACGGVANNNNLN